MAAAIRGAVIHESQASPASAPDDFLARAGDFLRSRPALWETVDAPGADT